jgi:biopolymer transport protein TolR
MPQLTPQQRIYIRKRTAVHDMDPSEAMGELNIVPFLDIVVNIIMFLLATTQMVLAIAQLDAQLPSLGRRVGRADPLDDSSTLNLSVLITRNGLIVSGEGAKLLPGCTSTQGAGAVITVPPTRGRLVWLEEVRRGEQVTRRAGPTSIALTRCVRQIKSRFREDTRVILTADPEIEFEHIIGAMDALRGDGADVLFPEVLISAGIR